MTLCVMTLRNFPAPFPTKVHSRWSDKRIVDMSIINITKFLHIMDIIIFCIMCVPYISDVF